MAGTWGQFRGAMCGVSVQTEATGSKLPGASNASHENYTIAKHEQTKTLHHTQLALMAGLVTITA
jgi:hypothetical protein